MVTANNRVGKAFDSNYRFAFRDTPSDLSRRSNKVHKLGSTYLYNYSVALDPNLAVIHRHHATYGGTIVLLSIAS
jgi:hypothetical protein